MSIKDVAVFFDRLKLSRQDQAIAQQILKEKAEEAKIELTEAESASVDAPNLIKDENGKEYHLSVEITREAFNEAVKPLVDQSAECIRQAMAEAKIEIDDIDRIILVGSSTRTPAIREMVTEMLGKEPYGDIDPGTAVAVGAAIMAATFELPGEKPPEDCVDQSRIAETNTTSHYLGIETFGQKFSPILDKGVEVPCENKKVYATAQDNQPELRISIFQFPNETEVIDMAMPGSACLGEFHLGPLDPAPKGEVQVEVAFQIDESGVLKIAANGITGQGISKELEVRIT
jgi:molecular chaperone DnaK